MGCSDVISHITVVGVVVILLVLGSGCLTNTTPPPNQDPADYISIGGGTTAYTEKNVVFSVEIVHDLPIDVEDLSIEFTLIYEGETVGIVTSNTSEMVDEQGFPEWRAFRNLKVLHLDHPRDSLGFTVTLYYKGNEVDRDDYERIVWEP